MHACMYVCMYRFARHDCMKTCSQANVFEIPSTFCSLLNRSSTRLKNSQQLLLPLKQLLLGEKAEL